MNLITVFLGGALVYTFLVMIFVIFAREQNSKARAIFVIMMLCFASLLVELAFLEERNSAWIAYIISFSGPLSLSIPILFYLYFKASINLNSEFNWWELKHLLLPLIYLALMMPYNVLDFHEKIEFLNGINRGWPLSLTPMRFTRLALITICSGFYFQLIWRELHIEINLKKADVLREIKKLKTAFLCMLVCIVFIFMFFLIRLPKEFTWALSLIIIAMVIIISLIFKYLPVFGHNFYCSPDRKGNVEQDVKKTPSELSNVDVTPPEESPNESKKYRSSVTSSIASDVLNNLTELLGAGLYKDSTLSLRKLASRLKTSNHHLSQIINEQTQGNYYELINRYRIAEAKRLLRETEMNVIDITYEVGFNSKSSFYTEFKRQSGLTPGQYKKVKLNRNSL